MVEVFVNRALRLDLVRQLMPVQGVLHEHNLGALLRLAGVEDGALVELLDELVLPTGLQAEVAGGAARCHCLVEIVGPIHTLF